MSNASQHAPAQAVSCACPYCGSPDISGNDLILASVGIQSFTLEGGCAIPEWAGGSKVHWDTSSPADGAVQFCCDDCGKEFETPRTYPHDEAGEPIEGEPTPGAFAELAARNARNAQRFSRAGESLWNLLAALEASAINPSGDWATKRDQLLDYINAPTNKATPG